MEYANYWNSIQDKLDNANSTEVKEKVVTMAEVKEIKEFFSTKNIKNDILREASKKYSKEYVALLAIDLSFYSPKQLNGIIVELKSITAKRVSLQNSLLANSAI